MLGSGGPGKISHNAFHSLRLPDEMAKTVEHVDLAGAVGVSTGYPTAPGNLSGFGESGSVGQLEPRRVLPANREAYLVKENHATGALEILTSCDSGAHSSSRSERSSHGHPHLFPSLGNGVLKRSVGLVGSGTVYLLGSGWVHLFFSPTFVEPG